MPLIEKKVNDKGIIFMDESRREFVYADRSMLEIVIQNLITNAVKFTGKGVVITVSNQNYNDKVLIWVENTPNIGSKFFIELPKAAFSE